MHTPCAGYATELNQESGLLSGQIRHLVVEELASSVNLLRALFFMAVRCIEAMRLLYL
jgi:hypothetical protein